MNNKYEDFENMLCNYSKDIFEHECMKEVFDDADFVFTKVADDSITVKCTLYNGHVIEEKIGAADMGAVGMDTKTVYALCMLKLSISAYEYFKNFIDDGYDISDTDDDCMYYVEKEPDCEHCEYFHWCCGDMDVVDIDFYSFN